MAKTRSKTRKSMKKSGGGKRRKGSSSSPQKRRKSSTRRKTMSIPSRPMMMAPRKKSDNSMVYLLMFLVIVAIVAVVVSIGGGGIFGGGSTTAGPTTQSAGKGVIQSVMDNLGLSGGGIFGLSLLGIFFLFGIGFMLYRQFYSKKPITSSDLEKRIEKRKEEAETEIGTVNPLYKGRASMDEDNLVNIRDQMAERG